MHANTLDDRDQVKEDLIFTLEVAGFAKENK